MSPNTLSVVPLDGWQVGVQYRVIVSEDLKSVEGDMLNSNAMVQFTRIPPDRLNVLAPEENY